MNWSILRPSKTREMRERVRENLKARVGWLSRYADGEEEFPHPTDGGESGRIPGRTRCQSEHVHRVDDPERVRNVPRIVRQNVAITSERFQTRSIPRRSCTITEWMNAVAVSHGSNDAFSTGSHAQ